MKKIIITLCLILGAASCYAAASKAVKASSPDGRTQVSVTVSDRIYFDVSNNNQPIFSNCHAGMYLREGMLGGKPALQSYTTRKVSGTVSPILPLKFKQVQNNYTLLTLNMAGGVKMEWRIYDDGIAYRFVTALKGDVEVIAEDATWNLCDNCDLILQQPKDFKTSCEESYSKVASQSWIPTDKISELPILVMGPDYKVLMSEFDLFDYPGTFFKGNGGNSFSAVHPKCPLEFEDDGDRSQHILKEADYIAKTSGSRNFPWRYALITRDDRKIPENTMSERLAPQNVIGDVSWVKPGLTCWDWLNGIPYGPDVDFKSGINLETYKYFVDFAARNGVKYTIMDEGWALDTRDPYTTNPEVHLPELIAYAKSKGVGIIVWLPWLTVYHHMDLFEKFEQWGIVGTKIDFMDRQDQWMVNFYEDAAKEAAKHHIMIDYHGAFHPSGLNYKYPNVLTFEGVRGMEFNGKCTPNNSVWFPFIRNAVGPMDYTPGSMLCMQPEKHHGKRPICTGVGTKAYNIAVFVLFESNLQMLMDNPCRYDQWPDCRDFLVNVPVNWDETRVLAAEAGEYCITAKRSADKWYIGGFTNDNSREFELPLDFLSSDRSYKMTSFEDGVNADIMAMDYLRKESEVKNGGTLKIRMARNGGFAAVLE